MGTPTCGFITKSALTCENTLLLFDTASHGFTSSCDQNATKTEVESLGSAGPPGRAGGRLCSDLADPWAPCLPVTYLLRSRPLRGVR
jgi:hypothetical protein